MTSRRGFFGRAAAAIAAIAGGTLLPAQEKQQGKAELHAGCWRPVKQPDETYREALHFPVTGQGLLSFDDIATLGNRVIAQTGDSGVLYVSGDFYATLERYFESSSRYQYRPGGMHTLSIYGVQILHDRSLSDYRWALRTAEQAHVLAHARYLASVRRRG